jgi:L-lactate dehydrogenase complex protein LldF
MRGVAEFGHLAFASSLCGACTETCPVKIDLHHHLLHIRQLYTRTKVNARERLGMKAFAALMVHPRLYRIVSRTMLTMDRWIKRWHGTAIDPLKAWRKTRTLPAKPPKSFAQWWRGNRS